MLKINTMKISKDKVSSNVNYLGYDEDYNGDFDEWFICPKCQENNYIKLNCNSCELCGEVLEWE